eukprot:958001-Alexandrium_andersonii.AAC.2
MSIDSRRPWLGHSMTNVTRRLASEPLLELEGVRCAADAVASLLGGSRLGALLFGSGSGSGGDAGR